MSNKAQALILVVTAAIDSAVATLKDTIIAQIEEALTEPSAPANPCDCPRERIEVQKTVVEGTQVRYDMPVLKKGAVYKLVGLLKGEQATINFNDPNQENAAFFEQNSGEAIFFEGGISGFPESTELAFDGSSFGSFSPTVVCVNSYSGIYKDFQGDSLPFGIVNNGRLFVSNAQPFFLKMELTQRRGGGIPVFQPTIYLL